MIEAVLASRNKKKIGEMRTLLSEVFGDSLTLLSLDDIGFEGEIEEDGVTFEENSVIKAATVAKLGYIGIADDSGLAVDALNGAPGVYSARYSEDCPDTGEERDTQNNNKLLREMADVPDEERHAAFVSTVACVIPKDYTVKNPTHPAMREITPEISARAGDMHVFVVRGEFEGFIGHVPAGCGGFGYDPLFFLPEYGMTSAEISAEEKNRISHRGKAVRAFGEVLKAADPHKDN